ncbi:MAG: hypothetical protein MZU97_01350 [Bacillus subtilis]|nr:hypothetical protein [Bacillus subtilis]
MEEDSVWSASPPGLFAALHAGMNHMPSTLRYRAYVAGDGIGKGTFFGWRLATEGILLTLAYLVFCAAYVAIGFACSVRFAFDLRDGGTDRMGWLFVLQAGGYASASDLDDPIDPRGFADA